MHVQSRTEFIHQQAHWNKSSCAHTQRVQHTVSRKRLGKCTVMQRIYILPLNLAVIKKRHEIKGACWLIFTNIDNAVTQLSLSLKTSMLNMEHSANSISSWGVKYSGISMSLCNFLLLHTDYFLGGWQQGASYPRPTVNEWEPLSQSLSLLLPFLTSHAGRQYLGAGKNSAAGVRDISLWCAEQMEGGNGEYQ